MQPGSYTVMDNEYAEIGRSLSIYLNRYKVVLTDCKLASLSSTEGFEPVFLGKKDGDAAESYRPKPPMTLLSTVVSNVHSPHQITIDAGLKVCIHIIPIGMPTKTLRYSGTL